MTHGWPIWPLWPAMPSRARPARKCRIGWMPGSPIAKGPAGAGSPPAGGWAGRPRGGRAPPPPARPPAAGPGRPRPPPPPPNPTAPAKPARGGAVTGDPPPRRAGPDGIPGEHLQDEIAAVLTLTGWTAARQVALAAAMTRLPDVAAALAAGWIDPDKARVFADELIVIDDDVAAAAIAASLVPRAPGMTTSELRRKLRQKIASFDPPAAKRRKEKAEKYARVESWVESNCTGAIAGRGMNLAKMI